MTEAAPTISFPKLECPDTILPTKKDLFEAFDGAASFPARLRAYAEGLVGDEAQKWIDQADQLDELLDGIKTALSQWDPKNKKPYIPGKDWEKLISRLREDYNMFVQKSILEIMATVIPIEFTVPILGIQIDLIALVTDPSSIKETIKGDIDKLYALLPEEFQSFKGEFGLDSDEYKIEQVFAYIKAEANKAMNALMTGGFTAIIGIFEKIWDLLNLPSFVPGAEFPIDIAAMLKEIVDAEKAKYTTAIEALGEDASQAAKDALKKELNLGIISGIEGLELFGFKIIDLIGGTWDEGVDCAEFKINRLKEEMNEFKENWYAYLMKKWMETVQKFLDMIGLGALMDWATFTFCDFLTLVGFPKALDLAFAAGITQVVSSSSGSLTSAPNSAGTVVTETSKAATDTTGYFKYTATAGQTVIAGVDDNGNILDYDVTGSPPAAEVLIMRRIAGAALEKDVNPIEITDYSTNAEGDTITLDDPVTVGDTITIVDLNSI